MTKRRIQPPNSPNSLSIILSNILENELWELERNPLSDREDIDAVRNLIAWKRHQSNIIMASLHQYNEH